MTDRELMRMALDAMESFESGTNGLYKGEFAEERKALRDRLAWPEQDAVLAEREACAEICETIYQGDDITRDWLEDAAAAIRARGEK